MKNPVLLLIGAVIAATISYFCWSWGYENYKIQDWFKMSGQVLAGLVTASLSLQLLFWSIVVYKVRKGMF